ncbi:MAG: LysR family transcriptional regulator [Terrimonas sp.]|nr:LysR family transcriptional regulator [Terrimonas sp.]
MNYTLHQLEVFLKIAQTKNITRAAEALHLSQPAVSIQLRNFQDQFEIPLTEVIGRKLFITDFGEEIANAAEAILNEAYAINYKTMAYKGKLTGRLKISIVSTGQYVMPYFLSGFMQQHEGVELQMDVTNKEKVVKSLENNQVDFSLVSVLPQHMNISKVELIKNKLFLVAPAEQRFKKKGYGWEILESLPMIFREPGSGTRHTFEQFMSRNNLPLKMKMELTSNEAVKQALIAGMGYSIMPLIGIKNELGNHDLQIIPVKGFPIISVWNLIWLKEKKLSPVAQGYLDYVLKEKANIVKEKFDWYENFK